MRRYKRIQASFNRWVSCTMGEEEVLWDPASSVNKDWKWK